MTEAGTLLPCPFCGGWATAWKTDDGSPCPSVWCRNTETCGAEVSKPREGLDVISAWNTRTKPTPVSGTDAVEVTQADIDAANAWFVGPFKAPEQLARLFARHRIQSLSRTEELVKALRKYGKHRPDCNAARALPFEMRSGAVPCTCGFLAALASHRGEGG